MQACAHCGEPLADAAARCPQCGLAVGGSLSPVVSQSDEPIGYERSKALLTAILIVLGLLAAAGVVWFWG
jgi:uncharacterized membrane protein YvbJ